MPDRLRQELIQTVAEIRAVLEDQRRLGFDRLHLPSRPSVSPPVPAAAPAPVADPCQVCPLCAGHRNRVAGVGAVPAAVCFVALAPGRSELEQGAPLVGDAGRLLDAILFALGLQRDEVYLTHLVKCALPEKGADPEALTQCGEHLAQELEQVSPRLVVALGETVGRTLLPAVTDGLRGRLHQWQGRSLLVTLHPLELVREPARKREAWADLAPLPRQLRLNGR